MTQTTARDYMIPASSEGNRRTDVGTTHVPPDCPSACTRTRHWPTTLGPSSLRLDIFRYWFPSVNVHKTVQKFKKKPFETSCLISGYSALTLPYRCGSNIGTIPGWRVTINWRNRSHSKIPSAGSCVTTSCCGISRARHRSRQRATNLTWCTAWNNLSSVA